jgi:hypothetical protein
MRNNTVLVFGMWTSWVQLVEKTRDACGQTMAVLHTQLTSSISPWKTPRLFRGLYTLCVQYYTATVGNYTPVNSRLYTQYTGLTKTTTN